VGADHGPVGEALGGVAEHLGDRQQTVHEGEVFPHLAQRLLGRGSAEQGRGGVGLLEVAADGADLADAGAVVQLQHGDVAGGILGAVLGGELLALHQVDRYPLHLDTFFGQKDVHTAGVGRLGVVVEFHI
jgi:hypothetical protein